jgi:AcrR family transcriptional regulator
MFLRMPLQIEDLDRQQLAVLGREWLLHGHLQDRVGMALVLESHDRDTMENVAIEEWMAASPIYSRRMQKALGFVGTDVATMMKNLQLDIGAPHQFMDFRYQLKDAEHGEFWLAHCGALMDVEPMGEAFVHGMCHAIEDPTFDATAGATNPLAQIRPIHRPPRIPSGRVPHCAWKIDIVADGPAVASSALEAVVAGSALAQLPIPSYLDDGTGGWTDYSGEFDPDFSLEDLSRSALLTALDEFGLQSHLLLRSLLLAVRESCGEELMVSMLPRQVRGWCGLTAQRLRDAFHLEATVEGVSTLLSLHPMMAPVAYTGHRGGRQLRRGPRRRRRHMAQLARPLRGALRRRPGRVPDGGPLCRWRPQRRPRTGPRRPRGRHRAAQHRGDVPLQPAATGARLMSTASFEPQRRQLTGRRPEMVTRLVDATVVEIAETGFDRMTVRLIAARAGVSTASAYSYFGSKEHLLTEVFWRRLTALPDPVFTDAMTLAERVEIALGPVALLVADEPELAAGVTTSLLAHDPDVKVLRDQMGVVFADRVGAALNKRVPEAAGGITMAFVGALLSAGMGLLDYRDIGGLLSGFAALLPEQP